MKDTATIEDLTKQLVKGSSITFIGSIIGKGLVFLSFFLLARILGADLLGLFILGLTIVRFLSLFSRMGLDTGSMKFISIYFNKDKEKVKGILFQSVSLSFLVGIALSVLLFLFSDFISIFFKKPELGNLLRIFSISIPFFSSFLVVAMATRGFQKMEYFVYIKEIFQPSINIILIIFFYIMGLSLIGAIYAWIISITAGLLLGFYLIFKIFPDIFNKRLKTEFEISKLLKFSFPLLGASFMYLLITWTDTLMIGYFRSSSEVGVYSIAAQIALLLALILNAFNSVFGPIIANLYDRGEIKKLNILFKIATKWAFYFTLPLFIILIFSKEYILLLFGEEFVVGSLVLLILGTAQLINNLTGSVGYMLIMSGREKLEFLNGLFVATLNIILNMIFIPKYGITGAAVATGISIVFINILSLVEVKYLLKLFPYDKRYWKGLWAGLLTLVIMFLISPIFSNFSNLVSFIAITSVVIVIYFLFLILFRFDKEDLTILKAIKYKLLNIL